MASAQVQEEAKTDARHASRMEERHIRQALPFGPIGRDRTTSARPLPRDPEADAAELSVSAREYDEIAERFTDLCPDAAVPKDGSR